LVKILGPGRSMYKTRDAQQDQEASHWQTRNELN
jgi:hypothetical protein